MWDSFVLAFAFTVAVADLFWRTIPRNLVLLGFFSGLTYHAFRGGFLSALAAAGLGFVLGLGFYELRAIGGGDVKLITALGAMLGFTHWLVALEVAITIAGLLALVGVIRRGVLLQTFRNMGRLLKHFFTNGLRPHPEIQVNNTTLVRIPFGVAAALGTLSTFIIK
jgi:prepilin peptidase CpaA